MENDITDPPAVKMCANCGLNPRYRHYSYCLDCRNKKRREKRTSDPEWRDNENRKRRDRESKQPKCKRDHCPNLSYSRGLCRKHIQEERRNDPTAARCSNGDGRPVMAKGLCNACLAAARRLDAGLGLCDVWWCEKNSYIRGLCRSHYRQAGNHNLEPDQLIALVANGCHACGSTYRLQIDHDHNCCDNGRSGKSCGKCIRGALCGPHNAAFGYLGDDTDQVRLLLEYALSAPAFPGNTQLVLI